MPDVQRVFHSRDEVHAYHEQWARQATLVGVPGAGSNGHLPGGGVGLAMAALIVEAVSGMTFWDYVHAHIFGRCGMSGSAFYTQGAVAHRRAHRAPVHAAGRRQPGGRRP